MTLTATSGRVTIITRLFGIVTPERLAAERRIIEHRAEMLDCFAPPKKPIFDLHPPDEEDGKWAGADF